MALSHLSQALEGRFAPVRCDIFNVWYAPAKSFHVVYEVYDAQGRREVVTVQFCVPGESLPAYRAACAEAAQPDRILHLAGWDAVGRLFPADSRLPALAEMLNTRAVGERLSAAGMPLADPDSMRWSLLSYLPGDRCALRYRWSCDPVGVVGKLQGNAGASHRAMLGLWSMPGRRFGMAEPLACDAELGLRWERFVPGQRVEQMAPRIGLDNALAQIMHGLVQLHDTPIEGLRLQRPQEVMNRLQRKVLPRIRDSLVALSADCDAFAVELGAAMERLPERPLCTVHGDLHTANILMTDAGPVLIDLDSLAQGDPAFDLALLGSRLLLAALNDGEDVGAAAEAVAELPQLYAGAGGAPVPREIFAWFMAALLVGRQIKTCIRHAAPNLDTLAPVLLTLAQLTLQRGRFGPDLAAQAVRPAPG